MRCMRKRGSSQRGNTASAFFNKNQLIGGENLMRSQRRSSVLKLLPYPKDIHQYIDDMNDVPKEEVELVYMPRRVSSVMRPRMLWTK